MSGEENTRDDDSDYRRTWARGVSLDSPRRRFVGGAALVLASFCISPGASAVDEKVFVNSDTQPPAEYLLVQEAGGGSFKEIGDGVWELALTNVGPDVIYFSNTPYTDAGTAPTQAFVENFQWSNKPNIAVVLKEGAKDADVLIVQAESKPDYRPASNQIVYRARVIGDFKESSLKSFVHRKDQAIPETFGPVSLFIDAVGASCWSTHVQCYSADICCNDPTAPMYDCGGMNVNQCWSWSHMWCEPCDSASSACGKQFPGCSPSGYYVYGCHTTGCPNPPESTGR